MTFKTPTILVIDDDIVDTKNIERLLKRLDYKIINASSGHEGLDMFSKNTVDCVLVDYFLHDLVGVNVVESIRRADPFVPIVMVTGMGDELVAVDALKHGAVDYFPKDCLTIDLLGRTITNALLKSEMSRKIHAQQFQLENYAHILANNVCETIKTIRSYLRFIHTQEKSKFSKESEDSMWKISELLTSLEGLVVGSISSNDNDSDEIKQFSLSLLVRRAKAHIENRLVEKKITVHAENLPVVSVNAPPFIQLFQNLLEIFANHSDIKDLHVKMAKKEDYYVFRIGNDHSPSLEAMEPQKGLETLFGVLEQQKQGAGLSLAICKSIVERHCGMMWSKSSEKVEAIYFSLPATYVNEQQTATKSNVVVKNAG